jgi:hypothetical protein
MGGKPAPGWVVLIPSAADNLTPPNHLNLVLVSASQKRNFFTQATILIDF